jgi:putative adhesin
MPRWTIDTPTSLAFDGVVALKVRLVSGSVAILAAQDAPRLDVEAISGQPLLVTHEAGILTITYEDMTWDGLLGWLRPQRHSATIAVTVPKDCPLQLAVVNASAIISGMAARTSIKSVSGGITMDAVTGNVDANTVSGDLEAQDVDGEVAFKTVSGDLTIAGGSLGRLEAKSVNGKITADVGLATDASVHAATVSGDVAIRLPSATSIHVDLRSGSGRVESAFDGMVSSGKPGSSGLTGTVGSGDGRLSVSTVSGAVTLLRRSPPADTEPSRAAAEEAR